MLMNGTFKTVASGRITFKNGIYQYEGRYVSIGGFAFGDLSNDGVDDAAVVLAESFTGGSMNGISFFAVINENGVPMQTNIIVMGDRAPIYKLNIQQGRLVVTGELGPWHEIAQFHTPVVMTYRLSGLDLYLTRFYSMDQDGLKREIRINSPADGTAVTCSVQVRGTITIAPSYSELVYAISDQAGKIFSAGSIPVKSDGAGGPGTFDVSIPLIDVPAGIAIQLDITQEGERADYSITLALDSVDLISE